MAKAACRYLRTCVLAALFFNFAGTRGFQFTYILPALSLSVFLLAYQATLNTPPPPPSSGDEQV